jgi:hypothetical protein
MRFLSLCNKKKTLAKRFEPAASRVRLGPQHAARETRQNLPIFYERSGVSFQGGDMGSRGNHLDFFFAQKAVAHLATAPGTPG